MSARSHSNFDVSVIPLSGAARTMRVEITRSEHGAYECKVDGKPIAVDALRVEPDALSLLVHGNSFQAYRTTKGENTEVTIAGETFGVTVRDPRSLRGRRGTGAAAEGAKKITAPMPGKVVRVLAPEGTAVEAGQGVIVIEAMKMQNELKSPKAGVVKKIAAAEGTTVNAGDTLAVVE